MFDEPTEIHEVADPIPLTDGDERFAVPRKYVKAILKAVPALRYSFEHLGGKYMGRLPAPVKLEKPIDLSSIGGRCVWRPNDHPAPDAPEESVKKENEGQAGNGA
jgi:hypothetical protein